MGSYTDDLYKYLIPYDFINDSIKSVARHKGETFLKKKPHAIGTVYARIYQFFYVESHNRGDIN